MAPPKKRRRRARAKEASQFLADEVVQSPDLIVGIDVNVLVHVFNPALLLQLHPGHRGHLVARLAFQPWIRSFGRGTEA